ncbi:hypothetical protein [Bosea rubneri]|uniref:Uncharacterized protein n=1 Tax=Bosea rubneri TaxID=3075434 RepID=A0ABU3S7V6_9HYPH|nr:hypothetical protein [Bosea sp. ZW T0_25]MDU0340834.1 hypothetical protein [Bosea sp. ZW T0_25]
MHESPAAIASLAAMRELLVLLKNKGILSSNEIVGMLNATDPSIAAENEFDQMLYKAYLWLKEPHLADSLLETLTSRKDP